MSNDSGQARVTVADAIQAARNLIEAHGESIYPDVLNVYTPASQDSESTNTFADGKRYRTVLVKGKDKALESVRVSFLSFCSQTGTKPRNMYDVWKNDSYTGVTHVEDFVHDISQDEMAAWIAPLKARGAVSATLESHLVKEDAILQPSNGRGADNWKRAVHDEHLRKLSEDAYKNKSRSGKAKVLETFCRNNSVLNAWEEAVSFDSVLGYLKSEALK